MTLVYVMSRYLFYVHEGTTTMIKEGPPAPSHSDLTIDCMTTTATNDDYLQLMKKEWQDRAKGQSSDDKFSPPLLNSYTCIRNSSYEAHTLVQTCSELKVKYPTSVSYPAIVNRYTVEPCTTNRRTVNRHSVHRCTVHRCTANWEMTYKYLYRKLTLCARIHRVPMYRKTTYCALTYSEWTYCDRIYCPMSYYNLLKLPVPTTMPPQPNELQPNELLSPEIQPNVPQPTEILPNVPQSNEIPMCVPRSTEIPILLSIGNHAPMSKFFPHFSHPYNCHLQCKYPSNTTITV